MTHRYCFKCHKELSACYCHKLNYYNIDSQIIILQHPTETKHPLNTANIAQLSLNNCLKFIGEDFSQHQKLHEIINSGPCFLIFPGLDQQIKIAAPRSSREQKKNTFILLDGTWKKAKKIYFKNKFLQFLPKIEFKDIKPSQYYLRKSPKRQHVSTLEAIIHLIEHVEGRDISNTLETLSYIQEYQLKRMGKDKFKKIYLSDQ